MTIERGAWPVAITATLAAALLTSAGALAFVREGRYTFAPTDARMYLTSGTALRRMTIGYSALAADLYWIRSIQYFGDRRLKNSVTLERLKNRENPENPETLENYDQLYPMLDLATSLDAALQHRLPLRVPVPGGEGTWGSRPAGPGHQATGKGIGRDAR
jgi:hypothetical protein